MEKVSRNEFFTEVWRGRHCALTRSLEARAGTGKWHVPPDHLQIGGQSVTS